jgi:hypothetical protein
MGMVLQQLADFLIAGLEKTTIFLQMGCELASGFTSIGEWFCSATGHVHAGLLSKHETGSRPFDQIIGACADRLSCKPRAGERPSSPLVWVLPSHPFDTWTAGRANLASRPLAGIEEVW